MSYTYWSDKLNETETPPKQNELLTCEFFVIEPLCNKPYPLYVTNDKWDSEPRLDQARKFETKEEATNWATQHHRSEYVISHWRREEADSDISKDAVIGRFGSWYSQRLGKRLYPELFKDAEAVTVLKPNSPEPITESHIESNMHLYGVDAEDALVILGFMKGFMGQEEFQRVVDTILGEPTNNEPKVIEIPPIYSIPQGVSDYYSERGYRLVPKRFGA